MIYKMIVTDLDDTILKRDKTISKKTIKYFKKLQALGYLIILASGRPYRAMLQYYELLELNTPLICDNGGVCLKPFDNTFEVKRNTIDQKLFNTIFRDNISIINEAFYSVFDEIYAYNRSGRLDFLYHTNDNSKLIEGRFDEIPNAKAPSGALFVIASENRTDFEDYFIKYDKQIKVRTLGFDEKNAIYEVYSSQINKGTMLEYLALYYNIKTDEIISFGDGENDIEMLLVSHGVAMKNATPDVLKSVNYVTRYDNNHDGVRKYLKKIL